VQARPLDTLAAHHATSLICDQKVIERDLRMFLKNAFASLSCERHAGGTDMMQHLFFC
jgi:hypothetical protein